MIVTLTMNPSVDRTAGVTGSLERGGVNRLTDITDVAGGKGINVARVINEAAPKYSGPEVLAVAPSSHSDPFAAMLGAAQIPHELVQIDDPVRVNLTVTEPDGTTTKLNAPGAEISNSARTLLVDTVVGATKHSASSWAVLCGSLPRGCPPDFYLDAITALHDAGVSVALDTSDAPLEALGAAMRAGSRKGRFLPDLIKPNGLELGQLLGIDGSALESGAEAGEFAPVADAARKLVDTGVGAALVTLGGAGALLATADGVWSAGPPDIEVRSTVGAGDSSLAGYLLAAHLDLDPLERLRWAVAHGSVAASLPGTGLPHALDMDQAPHIDVTSH